MSKPNNPPAFPAADSIDLRQEGMTLRDYFSAKAMQALIIAAYSEHAFDRASCVAEAGRYADAMLEEREKNAS